MLLEILTSTAFFWAISALWLILLFLCVEKDHGLTALLCTITYVIMLQFVFDVNLLQFLYYHPVKLGILAIVYFLIGAGWSFFRFYILVKKQVNEYLEARTT